MAIDLAGISKATATNTTGGGTGASNSAVDQGDRFLTLLVAQLKNQDPLNPLDNAQVTSQMAQVSTVQGIEKLNGTMGAMLNQIQIMQAGSLTGKDVMIDGNGLTVGGEAPARGGYEVPQGMTNVKIEVRNAQGAVIATIPQPSTPGIHTFTWDGSTSAGTAAPGNYTFTVSGTAGGQTGNLTTYAVDRIAGVIPNASGPRLSLAGGSTISLDAVKTIL
jgi:flagellar basal-body rod modification protein FlgD